MVSEIVATIAYVDSTRAEGSAAMTRSSTSSEIADVVRGLTKERGMTLDEFRQRGAAGTLADPELRDLWLTFRGVLSPA